MIVLGIETSCDETACAIIKDNKILSNVVLTQSIHKKYGGVVPDLASKDHEKYILPVLNEALHKAKIKIEEINGIAVTYGSGLLGSLIVGLNFAKGLSIALDVPFLGISHLEGHLYSSFINSTPIYPYLSLIVSGGHTQIWLISKFKKFKVISNTVDDAAGEAFDKGARILGLKYPGGPEIEKISKNGNPYKYKFPIPQVKSNKFNFSFSGLKTALLYKKRELDKGEPYSLNDLAASYQHAIIYSLLSKLDKVVKYYRIHNVVIAGGVSANKYFRLSAVQLQNKYKLKIIFPDMEYCTDNAAMIAKAGYIMFKNNKKSALNIEPNPNIIYK